MEQLRLDVDGMGCGGCVSKVRQALSVLPGVVVEDVRVGEAVVAFDSAQSSESAILAALASKNYPAKTKASDSKLAGSVPNEGGHCGV